MRCDSESERSAFYVFQNFYMTRHLRIGNNYDIEEIELYAVGKKLYNKKIETVSGNRQLVLGTQTAARGCLISTTNVAWGIGIGTMKRLIEDAQNKVVERRF